MRLRYWPVLLAACLQACPAGPHAAPRPTATKLDAATRIAANETTRTIAQQGVATELIGKVKLISDHGVGIISNNTGSLLSNNGAGVIANNGGGLVGKTKYALKQAADEALLAEAAVEVLDGDGHLLVDGAGKAIAGTTDAQGQYKLSAVLPAENLVLRVRLFNGGQLFALAIRGGSRTVDLDTASSLGTSYVLQQYVQNRKDVLAKLPESESTGLTADVEAARTGLKAPTYKPGDMVALVDGLRAKAPALDKRLEEIKAILLVGQAANGEGLPATQVPLSLPYGVIGDGKGNLYVAERGAGRVRLVDANGRASRYAGGYTLSRGKDGDPARKVSFDGPSGLALGADGTLYVADYIANRVRKVTPDGKVYTLAGDGSNGTGALGAATQASLASPDCIALGADGSLYFAEFPQSATVAGRILKLGADGKLEALPALDPAIAPYPHYSGMAMGPDGRLYVVDAPDQNVYAAKPGEPLKVVASGLEIKNLSQLAVDADGTIYLGEDVSNRLLRIAPDGTKTVIAGTGTAGYGGDGGPAATAQLNQVAGLWIGPGHQLYLCDAGTGLVRAIALDEPGMPIRTVAGTSGLTQQGAAQGVAINGPGGLAIDPQGRLVMTEIAGHTIKRLVGNTVEVIVGDGSQGYNGEGLAGTQTQLNSPTNVCFDGDTMYFCEAGGARIRRMGPDNKCYTVAGNGIQKYVRPAAVAKALDTPLGRVVSLAVDPRDHRLYYVDNEICEVLRLNPDGNSEVIAGGLDGSQDDTGDGGPARDARLRGPTQIAFGPDGSLYVADTGNLRIRRISALDTDTPRIDAFAGQPTVDSVAALLGGADATQPGPATQALMIGPLAVCFDKAGNLYESELGTGRLASYAALSGGLSLDAITPVAARVRRVDPQGRITSVTGPGTSVLSDPDADNSLLLPSALVIDAQGRLVVADAGNNQVVLLPGVTSVP